MSRHSAARKVLPIHTLTAEWALALLVVKDGADVVSRHLAMNLRRVEERFPEYVDIGPSRTHDGDPMKKVPYFGAIATKLGIEAALKVADWGSGS